MPEESVTPPDESCGARDDPYGTFDVRRVAATWLRPTKQSTRTIHPPNEPKTGGEEDPIMGEEDRIIRQLSCFGNLFSRLIIPQKADFPRAPHGWARANPLPFCKNAKT
jgi:hypothetical protein